MATIQQRAEHLARIFTTFELQQRLVHERTALGTLVLHQTRNGCAANPVAAATRRAAEESISALQSALLVRRGFSDEAAKFARDEF